MQSDVPLRRTIHQVKLVGMILNVDVSATTTNYQIDDGTGQAIVRIYTNEDAPQDLNSGCREDVYVKVVGNLRDISGQKILVAFQIHPVTNFNEITMHHLDVVHTHLKNTKGTLDVSIRYHRQKFADDIYLGQRKAYATKCPAESHA